jgi:transposase
MPENMGDNITIDETALIKSELYTIITNRDTGKLIALMEGTKSKELVEKILAHFSTRQLMNVKEVTLDMANSFDWVARQCFMNAIHTVDRFHVQKLVYDCMQTLRVVERQKILTKKREAKQQGIPFAEGRYGNGDTPRQLLARSRYLLFKPSTLWTVTQTSRATILFEHYPDLKEAYLLCQQLRDIYEQKIEPAVAKKLLHHWIQTCKESNTVEMKDAGSAVERHLGRIVNFWKHRSTNAYAECFNAKIKRFRGMVRGIKDMKFFLFRCRVYFA